MNSCFVSFMCLVSYCFSLSFYYCILYMYLFICFDESLSIQFESENRRRFVSLVGHLWYFMGLSCKVRFPWRRRTSGLTNQPAEGR